MVVISEDPSDLEDTNACGPDDVSALDADTEDLYHWTNKLIKNTLGGRHLIDNREVNVKFSTEEVHIYGDMHAHKKTKTVSFKTRIIINYLGTVSLGDTVMGELLGSINIPEITNDTLDQDWEFQVKAHEIGPNGDITRDLCPAEKRIVESIEASGDHLRKMVRRVLVQMCKYHEKSCLYMASAPPEETQEDGEAAEKSRVLTRELRLQCLPAKYKTFLDTVKEGKGAEVTAVDVSFCQLTDEDDFGDLLDAIKECENATTMDLSYNNLQDASVQKLIGLLVSGGFSKLTTLRLSNNKLTDVSKTMLSGLKVLRKDLTVVTE